MNINFKKVILHNFGSYSDAELLLQDRGLCALSGRNYFKKDCAFSNGSGKSLLFSAICFVLTGETIKGVKSGLKNEWIDENSCYAAVEFAVDADNYLITRQIAPKSDMIIIKNGVDISGKGIRESEKKLGELLPDLTKDLIASTIIIGQGMPNKFSSFSPVGRKELLEKLTKSDFMIDDIKQKVNVRLTELNKQMRQIDDNLLTNRTKLSEKQRQLATMQSELAAFAPKDYDVELLVHNNALTAAKEEFQKQTALTQQYAAEKDALNKTLLELNTAQSEELSQLVIAYNDSRLPEITKKSEVETELKAKRAEIIKLQSVKDICPTCGQKIPGVQKLSTEAQEREAAELEAKLGAIKNRLVEIDTKNQTYKSDITNRYAQKLTEAKSQLTTAAANLALAEAEQVNQLKITKAEEITIAKLNFDKANDAKHLISLQNAVTSLTAESTSLSALLDAMQLEKSELQQHIDIDKKIDSLIKRDFRGYLLTNIINYLDSKAKDYSEIVYGTRDLSLKIDGNALDISYCQRDFDNLSGGEQQRVDLILQFAIRDLLTTYLNYSSNILVLDEIYDNLDKVAATNITNLVTSKLTGIESIFIVSHHSDSLGLAYDSTVNIVKDANGISSIEIV